MKTGTLPLIFIMVILIGCSSGKKQLEHGNYRQAVKQAISRLQQKPHHQKAQQTLSRGYPLAVRYLEDKIHRTESSNDPRKWEWIASYYSDLNYLYDQIHRSPVALSIVTPKAYHEDQAQAQQQAADLRYEWGMQALSDSTRDAARTAYEHFEVTAQMQPDYPGINELLLQARDLATLRVMVDLVPVNGRRLQWSADQFHQELFGYMNRFEQGRFVDFILLEDQYIHPRQFDQVLRISFEDIGVGHTHLYEKEIHLRKDSVKIGEVTLDDGSVKPVWGTVKAKLRKFEKSVEAQGLVGLELIDAQSGQAIHYRQFPGQYQWFNTWATFRGDQRALDEKHHEWCGVQEQPVPDPHYLFKYATKPIQKGINKEIRYLFQHA